MGPVLKKRPISILETFIDIMDISKTLPERIRELSASVDSDPASKALDQIKGHLLQSIQDGEEAMRPKYEQALKLVVKASKLFKVSTKDQYHSKEARACADEVASWLRSEQADVFEDRQLVLQWEVEYQKAQGKGKSKSAGQVRSSSTPAQIYNHAKHGDLLNIVVKDLLGLEPGDSITGKEIKEKLGKGEYHDSQGKAYKALTVWSIIYKAGKDAAMNEDSPSILINRDRKYFMR